MTSCLLFAWPPVHTQATKPDILNAHNTGLIDHMCVCMRVYVLECELDWSAIFFLLFFFSVFFFSCICYCFLLSLFFFFTESATPRINLLPHPAPFPTLPKNLKKAAPNAFTSPSFPSHFHWHRLLFFSELRPYLNEKGDRFEIFESFPSTILALRISFSVPLYPKSRIRKTQGWNSSTNPESRMPSSPWTKNNNIYCW